MNVRSPLLRSVLPIPLVAIAYFGAAELGLQLALVEENVTPLWPPTGIALVGLLLFGRRVWPGIFAAAFLVNLPISANGLAAAVTAAGNTLAPFVAAEGLRRTGFRPELDRTRDAVSIVVAALGGMLISATVGAGTLVASDAIPSGDFPSAWAVWWAGDAMGVLVVAPFLLSLRRLEGPRWTVGRWVEAAVLLGVVAAASLLVMRSSLPLAFLLVPLLGLTAWRFQQRGAAPAALMVAGVAAWSASRGLGPFGRGSLLDRMFTLQAFNATAALTSFFFAAIVTERLRARESLERSAEELEDQVRERTETLTQRERQLAEAQQVAQIGSWEWRIPENVVRWSDEMYRIYGHPPQSFGITLERAMEQVLEEDRPPIQGNLQEAFALGRDGDVPVVEYRILRPDGTVRSLSGRGRLLVAEDGTPARMVGTVQDITDIRRAEREHRVAETLQRSLLPDRLPDLPGVGLAARYVPATADLEVGGDWYDVVQLANGFVGAAIGDVAGHGLSAASTMGQLRMALRAYALSEESPVELVRKTHRLFHRVSSSEMATLIYLVMDPDTGEIRFANAGHPPPLLVGPDGTAEYVREGLAPPLGALLLPEAYAEATTRLEPGSTLLLYTDGLVERRGVSLDEGLNRLRDVAAETGSDPETLVERALEAMVGEEEVADDVALLAIRLTRLGPEPVRLVLPAVPAILASLRHTLRRWLRESGASTEEIHDVLLASGEACTNAIQHAYGAREGTLEVELRRLDGEVFVTVRDHGTWRDTDGAEGGHGLNLMESLVDSVKVERGDDGTSVRLRRRLRTRARP